MKRSLPYFFLALPFLPALNIGNQVDVSSIRVIAITFFIIWIVGALLKQQTIIPKENNILFLLIFILLATASVAWAEDSSFAIRKSLYFLSLIPFVLVLMKTNKGILERCFKMFVLGAAASAVFGLIATALQFVVSAEEIVGFVANYIAPTLFGVSTAQAVIAFPSWFVGIGSETILRTFLPFPNPHTAALFWGMALGASILVRKNSLWINSALLLALLTTFSRSAYILVFIIGALFLFDIVMRGSISVPKINAYRFTGAILVVASIVIAVPYVSIRTQSAFSTTEGSTAARLVLWGDALAVASEKPLLGVGLGGYASALDPLAEYRVPTNAHSTYFEIFAELGIIGLALFALAITLPIRELFRKHREKIVIASASSIVIFATHAIFETNLYSPANLIVLLLMMAVVTRLRTKKTTWSLK